MSKKDEKELTQEKIKELLEYKKAEGHFYWIKAKHKYLVGKLAGGKWNNGYVRIKIGGVTFAAHRLAWFVENNEWPDAIDHINGLRDDNRIVNLRASEQRKNQQNRKTHREGRLPGTYFAKDKKYTKPWRARCTINGKKESLGCFSTELEAHQAYVKKVTELER